MSYKRNVLARHVTRAGALQSRLRAAAPFNPRPSRWLLLDRFAPFSLAARRPVEFVLSGNVECWRP